MQTTKVIKAVFFDPHGNTKLDWAASQCSDFTSALNLLGRILDLTGIAAEVGAPLTVVSEVMWLSCPIIRDLKWIVKEVKKYGPSVAKAGLKYKFGIRI